MNRTPYVAPEQRGDYKGAPVIDVEAGAKKKPKASAPAKPAAAKKPTAKAKK